MGASKKASLDDIRWNKDGLVPVVVQDSSDGSIRMMAWADRAALEHTLGTQKGTFFSRSRASQWVKGEQSGNTLTVEEIWLDCDGDTIIYRVSPKGPSCHTGRETCFFVRLDASTSAPESQTAPGSVLQELDDVMRARAGESEERSYTARLLSRPGFAHQKVMEEARELCEAATSESADRVANELADLLFHALALARTRGVGSSDVLKVLRARSGTSGLVEKASRKKNRNPTE